LEIGTRLVVIFTLFADGFGFIALMSVSQYGLFSILRRSKQFQGNGVKRRWTREQTPSLYDIAGRYQGQDAGNLDQQVVT
jgi:hypothetical protein